MQKKVKMYTTQGKWIVLDGERIVEFDKAYDAWGLVLMLKEIRPRVPYIRPLHPVERLVPKTARKKIVINI